MNAKEFFANLTLFFQESEDGIFCLCDSDDCNSGEPQDMDDCPTTEAPPGLNFT